MQTFLPLLLVWDNKLSVLDNLRNYFARCAKTLDHKRLGKQRVEAFQIVNIILKRTFSSAWQNHPIIKQWTPYCETLKLYENCFIQEWIRRGFINNMHFEKINVKKLKRIPFAENKMFIKKHQAYLVSKLPSFYLRYGWRIKSIKLNGNYWYIDGTYYLVSNGKKIIAHI